MAKNEVRKRYQEVLQDTKDDMESEKRSHDKEIIRICVALELPTNMVYTVEAIVQRINEMKEELRSYRG